MFRGQSFELDENVDLDRLAADYELAGGAIVNILHHVALAGRRARPAPDRMDDLLKGVRRETDKAVPAGGADM